MRDLRQRLERGRRSHGRRRAAGLAVGGGALFGAAGIVMAAAWWFPPAWIVAGVLALISLVFVVIGPITFLELL
jgi:hypothetical protein